MANNITRCPKCNTSFRIADSHLNTAKGSVRCGSCLHIFNAKEHLVQQEEETPVTSAHSSAAASNVEQKAVSSTPPASSKQVDQEPEDDILISDDMDSKKADEGLGNDYNDALFNSSSGDSYDFNLFEREDTLEETDDDVPQDESWALDLLENEDTDEPATPQPSQEQLEEQEERHNTEEFEASYYSNSFQIIDEPQPEEEAHVTGNSEAVRDIFESYEDEEIEEEYYDLESAPNYGNSNNYLDAIEPEPVEFNWQNGSSIWYTKMLWGSLCILSGLLLIVQVAWIKFDTLSVVKPYRTYYAHACNLVGCKLPDLIDRKRIKTANLVVRSHPKAKDALVVDAILQNTARFEQTFPSLDLVFTNQQDKTVAARRLKPSEYLGGELAGRTHMPIKQPIHIAIEIADPGNEAVGYRISIAD